MKNLLVIIALSFNMLWFVSCGDNEEGCACTAMACPDGVKVTAVGENGETFPDGVYKLRWEVEDTNGEVGTDHLWARNEDPAKQVFYIDRYSDSGELVFADNIETIMLELYKDGVSISERAAFDLIWKTTTCNVCTGPCEDLVTNADVEMVVIVPSDQQ